MGKKREHKTEAELRKQVEEEIPYVVGKGSSCIQARAKRLKVLFQRHGYPTTSAPSGFGTFAGAAQEIHSASGNRRRRRSSNIESSDNTLPASTDVPIFRGQRIA